VRLFDKAEIGCSGADGLRADMAGDTIAEVCVTVYEAKVSHCRLEWSYAVKYITVCVVASII